MKRKHSHIKSETDEQLPEFLKIQPIGTLSETETIAMNRVPSREDVIRVGGRLVDKNAMTTIPGADFVTGFHDYWTSVSSALLRLLVVTLTLFSQLFHHKVHL